MVSDHEEMKRVYGKVGQEHTAQDRQLQWLADEQHRQRSATMAKTKFLSEETDCPAGMPCEKVCREIKDELADLNELLRGPRKGDGSGLAGRVQSLEQTRKGMRGMLAFVLAAMAPLWAKLMGLIGK